MWNLSKKEVHLNQNSINSASDLVEKMTGRNIPMSDMDGVVNSLVSPNINEGNNLIEEGEMIIGMIGTLEDETNKKQMIGMVTRVKKSKRK